MSADDRIGPERLAGRAYAARPVGQVHPVETQPFDHSRVTREHPRLAALNERFGHLVLKTPAEGARTSVFVATDPSLAGVSGAYFANARRARPSPTVRDAALAERLWAWSADRAALRVDETPPIFRFYRG